MKKILFISGSLRKESFNKQLLEMAAQRLSSDFECTFLDYGDLPLLNQDEEFPACAENTQPGRIRRCHLDWKS